MQGCIFLLFRHILSLTVFKGGFKTFQINKLERQNGVRLQRYYIYVLALWWLHLKILSAPQCFTKSFQTRSFADNLFLIQTKYKSQHLS